MFGFVIFYPAGQPIRNRSGAEMSRMHGVPCCRSSGEKANKGKIKGFFKK